MSKSKKLFKLFLSTMYISAFTLGGGFVISTFMKKKFVDELKWIDENEMLDLIAIAQAAPGAIAVNVAILVGRRVCGFFGMITAVIGTVIPPVSIIGILSLFYNAVASNTYVALALKGMQAGVVAVIADVVCDLGKSVLGERSVLSTAVMSAAFIMVFFLKINVILVIACAIAVGTVTAVVKKKKKGVGENALR